MSGQTILICVDGSPIAERAFNYALDHMIKKEDCVIVVNVPEYNVSSLTSNWEQVCEEVKAKDSSIEACNARFIDALRHKGIGGRALKPKGGKAGEVIIETAKKEGADHIIIGTRGLGTLQRAFLGSVSQYVVNHADVPVSIIPNKKL